MQRKKIQLTPKVMKKSTHKFCLFAWKLMLSPLLFLSLRGLFSEWLHAKIHIFSALVLLNFEFRISILNGLFACNTLFKLSLDINSPLKEHKNKKKKSGSLSIQHEPSLYCECSMLKAHVSISNGYRLLVHPLHIFKPEI